MGNPAVPKITVCSHLAGSTCSPAIVKPGMPQSLRDILKIVSRQISNLGKGENCSGREDQSISDS